ncbi:hypothetical protein WKI68_11950 [Streptomyces sp. MS1.HAVA.3]|uniref:Polyketide synthase dimerisation element domain-containing protein n=1 Tax=Streptomyces caledonius TaxID=3134107 RepID=A0ABU8U299_9ACTN
MPALAAWRRDRTAAALADSWRYRVEWRPLTGAAARPGTLSGTWLVVVPADTPAADALADGLDQLGADTVRLRSADGERTKLAEQITAALDGRPLAGVLSLLALDTREDPAHPAFRAGTAATLTLLQALHDAEVTAPFWG